MPPRIAIRASTLRQLLPRANVELESPSLRSLRKLPQWRNSSPCFPPSRTFISTPVLLKKGGKEKAPKKEVASSEAEESTAHADPHDLSTLETEVAKCLEKLQRDLSKLRSGGRFNPELLENLRVVLDKGSKTSFRLGELAQVLPKGGRSLMLLVGEKEHIKPIVSAIQGAPNLNLQPQPDAQNSSQLNIAIPPPTKESRDQAMAAATEAGKSAGSAINNARATMQKKLRAIELKKLAREDDVRKARKEMEKMVEKAGGDVKKMVDTAMDGMKQS